MFWNELKFAGLTDTQHFIASKYSHYSSFDGGGLLKMFTQSILKWLQKYKHIF